jgi:hypothetical protein
MIPESERMRTIHALDRETTAIGTMHNATIKYNIYNVIYNYDVNN